MKKSICFLIALFLTLFSCSSDSETTTDAPLLIKKIVSTYENDSRTTNFTYNGTKLDAIIVDNFRLEYFYTGDNITKITRHIGDFLESENTYEYDDQGRVSAESVVNYPNDVSGKVVYTYNNNQTITFQEYNGSDSLPTNLGNNGTIYLNTDGEISQIETFKNDVYLRKVTNTFDTKNSFFKNITGYNKIPSYYAVFHNQLSFNWYNAANELTSNSTFEYVYNSSNFPTNCTQLLYQNGNVVNTVQISYYY